ncbi:MAG: carotenoid 1,2-hydratase [Gammaproteobacteria bacterium]
MPHNGYAWWYIDALSDDRRYGLTLIAFIGSVFSPYYALARRRGPADPRNYCAVNVALYGRGARRWAMTERSARSLSIEHDALTIGSSTLTMHGNGVSLEFDERTAPLPQRIGGRVNIYFDALADRVQALDSAARHRWRPLAPYARAEVELDRPSLRWSGSAYFDSNDGDAPLEESFAEWTWSRNNLPGNTVVYYDAVESGGQENMVALRFAPDGSATPLPHANREPLSRTLWNLRRYARADAGARPRQIERLVDAPFYSRSVVATQVFGQHCDAVHEYLSMRRFVRPWVQLMIPFRMPRTLR